MKLKKLDETKFRQGELKQLLEFCEGRALRFREVMCDHNGKLQKTNPLGAAFWQLRVNVVELELIKLEEEEL